MPILITTTIELVTMLFAAFGGFLGNMLPDVIEEGRFVSGFAAFVAVLIFLSIKILSRFLKRDNSRFVVFATLFFASATMFVWLGLEYRSELDRRLVRYPPHELSSPVY